MSTISVVLPICIGTLKYLLHSYTSICREAESADHAAGMAELSQGCIICEKSIGDEHDYTTLICHAAGQTICHTTHAHDKCWEKFKKTFVRGRGTSSRTQTFFCPVNGCHNALEHQHMSIRKKTTNGGRARGSESSSDSKYAALPGLDGAPRLPVKQGAEKRGKREPLEKNQSDDDEENRCSSSKADGTRCGRPVFDHELRVCKLHAESARRAAEFARKVAQDLEQQKDTTQVEETPEDLPPITAVVPVRSRGINIEIPDGPAKAAESDTESVASKDKEAAAVDKFTVAPLKPAPWAAKADATNLKKGSTFTGDERLLDNCPVCMEEKAYVQMKPCGHTLCGGCLDLWTTQRSSFAQTLLTGSSVTTCPLCRAGVQETATVSQQEQLLVGGQLEGLPQGLPPPPAQKQRSAATARGGHDADELAEEDLPAWDEPVGTWAAAHHVGLDADLSGMWDNSASTDALGAPEALAWSRRNVRSTRPALVAS
eukprot:1573496-Pleurochrysis_carterae.AAC.4